MVSIDARRAVAVNWQSFFVVLRFGDGGIYKGAEGGLLQAVVAGLGWTAPCYTVLLGSLMADVFRDVVPKTTVKPP